MENHINCLQLHSIHIQRTSSTQRCRHQEPEQLTHQLTFNYFPELSPAIVLQIQIIHIAVKMTMVGLAEWQGAGAAEKGKKTVLQNMLLDWVQT